MHLHTHMECAHEVQFCSAVDVKCNADETESGYVLPLFEHPNKRIVSMQDHDDVVQEEMLRENNFSGYSKP